MVKSMVYPVPAIPVSSPPAPYREVALHIDGHTPVDMWVVEPTVSEASIATIVFFHGNGENLETVRQSGKFESFRSFGCTAAAIDYPGYGRSGGRPSEKSLAEAADSAVSWVLENLPDKPVILCGWSLGAGVAAGAAKRHNGRIKGVILMSPWTTLEDVASTRFPRFLVRIALRDKYNSVEAVNRITVPVLVLHGTEDRVIPVSQGKTVASHAPSLTKWIPIEGIGHTGLLSHAWVNKELAEFIKLVAKE